MQNLVVKDDSPGSVRMLCYSYFSARPFRSVVFTAGLTVLVCAVSGLILAGGCASTVRPYEVSQGEMGVISDATVCGIGDRRRVRFGEILADEFSDV